MRRTLAKVSVGVLAFVAAIALWPANEPHKVPPRSVGPQSSAFSEALPYRELRDTRRGDNGRMYLTTKERLAAPYEQALGDVDPAAAHATRMSRRAFDGAPPTVPHAVTQRTHDCVACHGEGAVVAGIIAPRMLHEMRPSCTQCHVPGSGARQDERAPLMVENDP